MRTQTNLPDEIHGLLRCPVCRAELRASDGKLACSNPECGSVFPVVNRVPVLINEASSIFRIADFIEQRPTTYQLRRSGIKRMLHAMIPKVAMNTTGRKNYAAMRKLLLERSEAPVVLVIGGGIWGAGLESLAGDGAVQLVESDVCFGPCTKLICDAHDMPFADGSFDGVVAQAVLEHVTDPFRCVAETWRVLKPDGLVYAETPFMYPQHMKPYDFTRFTMQGHRRLFRWFDEIDSGPAGGPATALALAYVDFLASFGRSPKMRAALRAFGSFTSFCLKYLDRFLASNPYAATSTSGLFFLGRKAGQPLDDRELLRQSTTPD